MSEIGVTWMQCIAVRADGAGRTSSRRVEQALAAIEALEALFPHEILAYAERVGLRSAVDRIRERLALEQPGSVGESVPRARSTTSFMDRL